jgi:hypothetical protein
VEHLRDSPNHCRPRGHLPLRQREADQGRRRQEDAHAGRRGLLVPRAEGATGGGPAGGLRAGQLRRAAEQADREAVRAEGPLQLRVAQGGIK